MIVVFATTFVSEETEPNGKPMPQVGLPFGSVLLSIQEKGGTPRSLSAFGGLRPSLLAAVTKIDKLHLDSVKDGYLKNYDALVGVFLEAFERRFRETEAD